MKLPLHINKYFPHPLHIDKYLSLPLHIDKYLSLALHIDNATYVYVINNLYVRHVSSLLQYNAMLWTSLSANRQTPSAFHTNVIKMWNIISYSYQLVRKPRWHTTSYNIRYSGDETGRQRSFERDRVTCIINLLVVSKNISLSIHETKSMADCLKK